MTLPLQFDFEKKKRASFFLDLPKKNGGTFLNLLQFQKTHLTMISSTYTFLKVKKFTSKYKQNDAPATIGKSEKKTPQKGQK